MFIGCQIDCGILTMERLPSKAIASFCQTFQWSCDREAPFPDEETLREIISAVSKVILFLAPVPAKTKQTKQPFDGVWMLVKSGLSTTPSQAQHWPFPGTVFCSSRLGRRVGRLRWAERSCLRGSGPLPQPPPAPPAGLQAPVTHFRGQDTCRTV